MSFTSIKQADFTGTSASFASFHTMSYTPKRDSLLVVADWGASSATAASTVQLVVDGVAYPLGTIALDTTSRGSRTVLAKGLKTNAAITIALQYKAAATGTFSCSPATAGTAPYEWGVLTVLDDVPRG